MNFLMFCPSLVQTSSESRTTAYFSSYEYVNNWITNLKEHTEYIISFINIAIDKHSTLKFPISWPPKSPKAAVKV